MEEDLKMSDVFGDKELSFPAHWTDEQVRYAVKAIMDYDLCYEESKENASHMYKNFYAGKDGAVGLSLCDSPSGIQTQIDNMLCGIKDDFDKLKQERDEAVELLAIYQRAVNKIDDMFEYAHGTDRDRKAVRGVLSEITDGILKIKGGK